ncbi:MAG: hypothetical protein ACFB4I_24410 [Cyanophyceae cyanobacterium]
MHSWSDINFELTETDVPMVTTVAEQQKVLLYSAGCLPGQDGRGFTLCLKPAHIPVIEKLLAELYALKDVSPADSDLEAIGVVPW